MREEDLCVTNQHKVCAANSYNKLLTWFICLLSVQPSFFSTKPDAFYSNRFLRHKQVCKNACCRLKDLQLENQRWCYSSVRAVLGSRELDKLNSFHADGHGDFLNSCNASQLEQNKAQANIREVKQNKVA